MRSTLIMIAGHKCVGKDMTASYMQNYFESLNYTTAQVNFADHLKEVASKLFQCGKEHLHRSGEYKEKTLDFYPHESPREIMQKISVLRREWPDIWAHFWGEEVKHLHEKEYIDFIFCTDLRYQDELNWLENLTTDQYDKHIIKVVREGFDGDGHASEQLAKTLSTEYTIWNDTTLHELEVDAHAIAQSILHKRGL